MFNFKEYIDLAEEWVKEKDESLKRTAVSRAYYGALIHTREYLKEIGKMPNSKNVPNSHEAIWQALSSLGKKQEIIAQSGLRLKEKRKNADYDLTIKGNISNWASMAVYEAKSIVKRIDELRKQKPNK